MKKIRNDPYQTLGVGKNATPEELKAARRKKARDLHPDKGGDHNAMAAVNNAFDLLNDPQRRQHYDETGSDRRVRPLEEEARQLVLVCFQQALESDAPVILTTTRKLIRNELESAKQYQTKLEQKRTRLEGRRDKIIVKTGENLFQMLLEQQLATLEQQLARCLHDQQVRQAAMKLLDEYLTSESEVQLTVEEQIRKYMHNSLYDMYVNPVGGHR